MFLVALNNYTLNNYTHLHSTSTLLHVDAQLAAQIEILQDYADVCWRMLTYADVCVCRHCCNTAATLLQVNEQHAAQIEILQDNKRELQRRLEALQVLRGGGSCCVTSRCGGQAVLSTRMRLAMRQVKHADVC